MSQWLFFFLDILLAVALVQFITQQLLGNPLSPHRECAHQQRWAADVSAEPSRSLPPLKAEVT